MTALIHVAGWTLVSFLWQGAVIGASGGGCAPPGRPRRSLDEICDRMRGSWRDAGDASDDGVVAAVAGPRPAG